jgi:hypothetical protein
VIIGDSMIYGSGLPYSETLRPVLARMGRETCVFGVAGNGTVDYLATLEYVREKIEGRATITIYLYLYNDIVSISKYFRRRFGALSSSFETLADVIVYLDAWRQTTHTYRLLHAGEEAGREKKPVWEVALDEGTLRFARGRDPARYEPPGALEAQQRTTLRWFFEGLLEIVEKGGWDVSVVLVPDNEEMLANLARGDGRWLALDQRRDGVLDMCRDFGVRCEDLGPYLYERTLDEGRNPYFVDDRHFSALGTRIVAEHYLQVTANATRTRGAGGFE